MRTSSALFASTIVVALTMAVPLKASAQGITIYVGPGYPGYGGAPLYDDYPVDEYPAEAYYPPYYGYPSYGYSYPSFGYGYGYRRPYVGTYWGQGRRIARRVNRRWNRWGY
jgi:hypothetical protein